MLLNCQMEDLTRIALAFTVLQASAMLLGYKSIKEELIFLFNNPTILGLSFTTIETINLLSI